MMDLYLLELRCGSCLKSIAYVITGDVAELRRRLGAEHEEIFDPEMGCFHAPTDSGNPQLWMPAQGITGPTLRKAVTDLRCPYCNKGIAIEMLMLMLVAEMPHTRNILSEMIDARDILHKMTPEEIEELVTRLRSKDTGNEEEM